MGTKPAPTTPAPPETQPATTPEQQAPERPSFDEVMGHFDAYLREDPELRDKLRSHDIVAGIAGDIAEKLAAQSLDIERQQAAEEGRKQAEANLRKLAKEDPEAFTEQWLADQDSRVAKTDIQRLRFEERKALSSALGRAVADLPEWKEVSTQELADLAKSMTGIPDDQTIPVWQKAVTDLIARKRGSKLAASEVEERVKAEREVWEAEHAAERVRGSPAPNLRSGEPASGEMPDWRADPAAFNRAYEEKYLKRGRR